MYQCLMGKMCRKYPTLTGCSAQQSQRETRVYDKTSFMLQNSATLNVNMELVHHNEFYPILRSKVLQYAQSFFNFDHDIFTTFLCNNKSQFNSISQQWAFQYKNQSKCNSISISHAAIKGYTQSSFSFFGGKSAFVSRQYVSTRSLGMYMVMGRPFKYILTYPSSRKSNTDF